MPTLTDKTILVTGASQGLGEQVAKAYAAAGATVILVARHQKKLEKVYDAIVEAGYPEPFAICFDLISAEEKEFEHFAATIAEATQGKLDGIVHCASYFYALSPLDFQTVAESPDASVIFVGESHGENPKAYWGGFGASKAALNYLCKVAADEWERFGNLRANVLIPGPINSPQRIKSHPGEAKNERKNYEDVLPQFVWWASSESKGRSGEIVYL